MGANGFPTAVYKPVLEQIEMKLRSSYPYDKQSNERWVGCSDIYARAKDCTDWRALVTNIENDIERRNQGPVIGVGHSVGGALLSAVSTKRPDLFQKLILIDSPFFQFYKRLLWCIAFRLTSKETRSKVYRPLTVALGKKNEWRDRSEAIEYFKSKHLYANMHPDMFMSFIDNGLVTNSQGGLSLLFSNIAEANMMESVPLEIPYISPRHHIGIYDTKISGHFLYSDTFDFMTKSDLNWIQSRFRNIFLFTSYSGGHFIPFNHPDRFVDMILDIAMSDDL
jgi:pimeloyl-ACP methyl ester carboxylesterase